MSGGICVLPTGMTSPSRSGCDLSSSPPWGDSSTNCSPTAERLCTAAVTSAGILVDDWSFSTARTPSGVTSMDVTLPISEPR